ncbi:MAG: homoserine O-acetyltransferase, partial [Muribaculaceae bacterium]|nr:homoserine O-acetyltransferase [Muribaculaceae bacterium]
MLKTYRYPHDFRLESGAVLHGLDIAYHTYGQYDPVADNAVWVCHALTANSDVADWWPGMVVEGGFLDPADNFTVCANIIGSCYGSTGPTSVNPDTGEPYYADFPELTIRDMARALTLLADHLGLGHIGTLVGSSVGGFQALEWACEQPWRFGRLVLIATDAKASPWCIAIDETQRMAITSDSTYGERRPDAAAAGLEAARAIGLLSYRGPEGYNRTQQNEPAPGEAPVRSHRACSYQRYQGRKLSRRFNAYSYVKILNAFDTHDVGRGRGGLQAALARLTMPAIVIGISSDIVFTPPEM